MRIRSMSVTSALAGGVLVAGLLAVSAQSADAAGRRCLGEPATIVVPAANRTTSGTDGDDVIVGTGGNDVIEAGGGNDLVCGGAGSDTLRGGDGNDVLTGQIDRDVLEGGAGDDRLLGNESDDRLTGGPGTDRLMGGPGDNECLQDDPGTKYFQCYAASIAPDPDHVASATVGQPVARSYQVTNNQAAFKGRLVGAPLDSARVLRPTIDHLEQQTRQVDVPAGATSLTATIDNADDPGADLDLFVFRCTAPSVCNDLVNSSASGSSEESVTTPVAGPATYLIVVDAYDVPAGSTAYDYLDVYDQPGLGSVVVNDSVRQRPTGKTSTAPATITAQASPEPGRVLRGVLSVLLHDGTTIGTSSVVIDSLD